MQTTSSSVSYFLFILLYISPPFTFASEKSYVVYLGSHLHGRNPTLSDFNLAVNSHYELLGSVTQNKEEAKGRIFYSYTETINGFAAVLNEKEAEELRKHPDVISVFPNRGKRLHTTRSWQFLGLETEGGNVHSSSLWKKANFGKDVIIGNLDTGVYPESKSFDDRGMGPIPSRWRGSCQHDDTPNKVRCNRKLIGARYFNKGYASLVGKLNSTFHTARDNAGHGSHTLSTAAGGFVPSANVFGFGNGTAKGGSPHARVAAYKVCWPPIEGSGECFDADILAGFDAAISDGIDVLSVSLGGDPVEYFDDPISIGAFHAAQNGIVVVASGGNSGPEPGTVSNVGPWIVTVAASTMDREFTNWVRLGNGQRLKGASLSQRTLPKMNPSTYPLILGSHARHKNQSAQDAELCKEGSLDSRKVKGKILVCLRGENGRAEKGEQALRAGAAAMVLRNDEKSGNDIIADAHVLPAAHVSYKSGVKLLAYMNSTKGANATLTTVKTYLSTKPAPFMASFSSRGPNIVEESLLKPDVTAPGVSVIAAFTLSTSPTEEEFDKRRVPYNSQSGTSMSCPHVAGIAGLLKAAHPSWSPAAIKSAIMTTARTRDNKVEPLLDASDKFATPFAYGSGHIRPNKAVDPGLVYDLTTTDYMNFLCSRGYNSTQLIAFFGQSYHCPKSFKLANFNYPSITVRNFNQSVTITRRIKNVGVPATYTLRVKQPRGVMVHVSPSTLVFSEQGQEKTFKLSINATRRNKPRDYVFGGLTWTDGKHYVKSPIVVKHF